MEALELFLKRMAEPSIPPPSPKPRMAAGEKARFVESILSNPSAVAQLVTFSIPTFHESLLHVIDNMTTFFLEEDLAAWIPPARLLEILEETAESIASEMQGRLSPQELKKFRSIFDTWVSIAFLRFKEEIFLREYRNRKCRGEALERKILELVRDAAEWDKMAPSLLENLLLEGLASDECFDLFRKVRLALSDEARLYIQRCMMEASGKIPAFWWERCVSKTLQPLADRLRSETPSIIERSRNAALRALIFEPQRLASLLTSAGDLDLLKRSLHRLFSEMFQTPGLDSFEEMAGLVDNLKQALTLEIRKAPFTVSPEEGQKALERILDGILDNARVRAVIEEWKPGDKGSKSIENLILRTVQGAKDWARIARRLLPRLAESGLSPEEISFLEERIRRSLSSGAHAYLELLLEGTDEEASSSEPFIDMGREKFLESLRQDPLDFAGSVIERFDRDPQIWKRAFERLCRILTVRLTAIGEHLEEYIESLSAIFYAFSKAISTANLLEENRDLIPSLKDMIVRFSDEARESLLKSKLASGHRYTEKIEDLLADLLEDDEQWARLKPAIMDILKEHAPPPKEQEAFEEEIRKRLTRKRRRQEDKPPKISREFDLPDFDILSELPDLPDAAFFRRTMEREIRRSLRYNSPLSCVIFGIDALPPLLATWGETLCHTILCHMGEILQASVREVDIPAYLDGEVFGVILPETGISGAQTLLYRLRSKMKESFSDLLEFVREISFTFVADFFISASKKITAGDFYNYMAALYRAKMRGSRKPEE